MKPYGGNRKPDPHRWKRALEIIAPLMQYGFSSVASSDEAEKIWKHMQRGTPASAAEVDTLIGRVMGIPGDGARAHEARRAISNVLIYVP